MITRAKLKKILDYDRETGVFKWLVSPTSTVRAGDVAGKNRHGYILIGFQGKKYFAHRLAWLYIYGEWPKLDIDHINHITDDNRIINLREVTKQENQRNRSIGKNNNSGLIGVGWASRENKWRSRITIDYKDVHLGYFDDWFEAACSRKSADNKFGFHHNHGQPNEAS